MSPRRWKRPASLRCRFDACAAHHHLDVAQLGRVPGSGPGSAGSIPAVETMIISECSSVWQSAAFGTQKSQVQFLSFRPYRTVAQPGRALPWGGRGRGFNSRWSDQMARVQQTQVSCMPANSGRPVGVRTIFHLWALVQRPARRSVIPETRVQFPYAHPFIQGYFNR